MGQSMPFAALTLPLHSQNMSKVSPTWLPAGSKGCIHRIGQHVLGCRYNCKTRASATFLLSLQATVMPAAAALTRQVTRKASPLQQFHLGAQRSCRRPVAVQVPQRGHACGW